MSSSILLKNCRRLFILALILFSLSEAIAVFGGAVLMVRRFKAAGWNYEERRRDFKDAAPLMDLRAILPDGAVVQPPLNGNRITFVAARYILYPVPVLEEGKYLIDFKGDVVFPLEGHIVSFPDHAWAYAPPGSSFLQARGPARAFSVFQAASWSLIFILFQWLLGAAFLDMFGFPPCRQTLLFYPGLSYLTGYLFFTVSLWLFYLAARGEFVFDLLLVSGVALAGTVFIMHRGIIPKVMKRLVSGCHAAGCCPAPRTLWPGVLLGAVTACIISMTISTPVIDWDGMSHWILKAKIIAHQNQMDFSFTHNNYYPLLWPLNIAAQFVVSGGLYDALAQWTSAALFFVFAGALVNALESLSAGKRAARLMTALFVVLSFRVPLGDGQWFYNYRQANAENLFLAFLAGLLLMMIRWFNSRETRYLAMAVVLGTGLVLTKLEGAVAVAAAMVPVWGLSRRLKITRKEFCLFMLLTLSMALPLLWILWVNGHGYGESMLHVRSGLTWGKMMLLTQRISGYVFIVLGLLAAGIALVSSVRKPWPARDVFLAAQAAGLLGFSVFAISGWPEAKLKTTSLEVFQRLFLHAAPAIVLFCVSRFYSNRSAGESLRPQAVAAPGSPI